MKRGLKGFAFLVSGLVLGILVQRSLQRQSH